MIDVRFMYVTAEAALLELEGQMPALPFEEMLLCPDGVHSLRASVVSWHRDRGVEVMLESQAGRLSQEDRLTNAQMVAAGWTAVGMKAPK